MKELKILTYNVNGIRAAQRKGFVEWLAEKQMDVVCLQEIKANADQIEVEAYEELGYHCHWFSAQKKGYSGVAILSKTKPDKVVAGIEHELFDNEGRVLRADIGDVTILSCYFPSGTSGDIRQDIKMQFLEKIMVFAEELRKTRPKLVICGDYNIAHTEIDIHNPKSNKKNSGFLPEERQWMTDFFATGYTDTFRHFNEGPHNYSWWSYRSNARANNKGWRIDYISTTEEMKEQLLESDIFPEAKHSDHCPCYLKIKI